MKVPEFKKELTALIERFEKENECIMCELNVELFSIIKNIEEVTLSINRKITIKIE